MVWTLTTYGKTEKAYASLRLDYKVDDVVKASEVGALLNHTLLHSSTSTQIVVVTTRNTPAPYKALLTSRVDVLNLTQISRESLLIY